MKIKPALEHPTPPAKHAPSQASPVPDVAPKSESQPAPTVEANSATPEHTEIGAAPGSGTEPKEGRSRPLTIVINEKTYKRVRALASLEGGTISGIVTTYLNDVVPVRLRAALATAAKDLE